MVVPIKVQQMVHGKYYMNICTPVNASIPKTHHWFNNDCGKWMKQPCYGVYLTQWKH